MDNSIFFKEFNEGILLKQFSTEQIGDLEWNAHPKFKGVYLKNVVKGCDTNNTISCHVVKIKPNCTLSMHVHENNIEIHEVINGSGLCKLDDSLHNYKVGVVAVIPKATKHEVTAGDNGLYLFAKFSPALV